MNEFIFPNTSYKVTISTQTSSYLLNGETSYTLSFYNSLTKVLDIVFPNTTEIVNFILNFKVYIEEMMYHTYDLYYIYFSNVDYKGESLGIATIKKFLEYPTDEEIIQMVIYQYNHYNTYSTSSVRLSIDSDEYILEEFLIFLLSFLENNNIDIISYSEQYMDQFIKENLQ